MKISGSKLLSGMRRKQESTKDNIKTSTFRLLAEHGYATYPCVILRRRLVWR